MGYLDLLNRGGSRTSSYSDLLAQYSQSSATQGAQTEGTGVSDRGGLSQLASLGAGLVNPVLSLLDVVDTPRAIVTSGIKEVTDLARGEGASFEDFVRQARDNIGAGDLIADWDANIWAKRGLGFLGEVVLDPLSYLGAPGAGALARGGSRALAQQVATDTLLNRDISQKALSQIVGEGKDILEYRSATRAALQLGARRGDAEAQVLMRSLDAGNPDAALEAAMLTVEKGWATEVNQSLYDLSRRGGGVGSLRDDDLVDVLVGGDSSGLRIRPFWRNTGGPQILSQARWSNWTATPRKTRGRIAESKVGQAFGKRLGNPRNTALVKLANEAQERGDSSLNQAYLAGAVEAEADELFTEAKYQPWEVQIREVGSEMHRLTDSREDLLRDVETVMSTPDVWKSESTFTEALDRLADVGIGDETFTKIRTVLKDIYEDLTSRGIIVGDLGETYWPLRILADTIDAADTPGKSPRDLTKLHSRTLPRFAFGHQLPSVERLVTEGHAKVDPLGSITSYEKEFVNWPVLRQEIENAARATLGDEWHDLWERDPGKVLLNYVQSKKSLARDHAFANALIRRGVADWLPAWELVNREVAGAGYIGPKQIPRPEQYHRVAPDPSLEYVQEGFDDVLEATRGMVDDVMVTDIKDRKQLEDLYAKHKGKEMEGLAKLKRQARRFHQLGLEDEGAKLDEFLRQWDDWQPEALVEQRWTQDPAQLASGLRNTGMPNGPWKRRVYDFMTSVEEAVTTRGEALEVAERLARDKAQEITGEVATELRRFGESLKTPPPSTQTAIQDTAKLRRMLASRKGMATKAAKRTAALSASRAEVEQAIEVAERELGTQRDLLGKLQEIAAVAAESAKRAEGGQSVAERLQEIEGNLETLRTLEDGLTSRHAMVAAATDLQSELAQQDIAKVSEVAKAESSLRLLEERYAATEEQMGALAQGADREVVKANRKDIRAEINKTRKRLAQAEADEVERGGIKDFLDKIDFEEPSPALRVRGESVVSAPVQADDGWYQEVWGPTATPSTQSAAKNFVKYANAHKERATQVTEVRERLLALLEERGLPADMDAHPVSKAMRLMGQYRETLESSLESAKTILDQMYHSRKRELEALAGADRATVHADEELRGLGQMYLQVNDLYRRYDAANRERRRIQRGIHGDADVELTAREVAEETEALGGREAFSRGRELQAQRESAQVTELGEFSARGFSVRAAETPQQRQRLGMVGQPSQRRGVSLPVTQGELARAASDVSDVIRRFQEVGDSLDVVLGDETFKAQSNAYYAAKRDRAGLILAKAQDLLPLDETPLPPAPGAVEPSRLEGVLGKVGAIEREAQSSLELKYGQISRDAHTSTPARDAYRSQADRPEVFEQVEPTDTFHHSTIEELGEWETYMGQAKPTAWLWAMADTAMRADEDAASVLARYGFGGDEVIRERVVNAITSLMEDPDYERILQMRGLRNGLPREFTLTANADYADVDDAIDLMERELTAAGAWEPRRERPEPVAAGPEDSVTPLRRAVESKGERGWDPPPVPEPGALDEKLGEAMDALSVALRSDVADLLPLWQKLERDTKRLKTAERYVEKYHKQLTQGRAERMQQVENQRDALIERLGEIMEGKTPEWWRARASVEEAETALVRSQQRMESTLLAKDEVAHEAAIDEALRAAESYEAARDAFEAMPKEALDMEGLLAEGTRVKTGRDALYTRPYPGWGWGDEAPSYEALVPAYQRRVARHIGQITYDTRDPKSHVGDAVRIFMGAVREYPSAIIEKGGDGVIDDLLRGESALPQRLDEMPNFPKDGEPRPPEPVDPEAPTPDAPVLDPATRASLDEAREIFTARRDSWRKRAAAKNWNPEDRAEMREAIATLTEHGRALRAKGNALSQTDVTEFLKAVDAANARFQTTGDVLWGRLGDITADTARKVLDRVTEDWRTLFERHSEGVWNDGTEIKLFDSWTPEHLKASTEKHLRRALAELDRDSLGTLMKRLNGIKKSMDTSKVSEGIAEAMEVHKGVRGFRTLMRGGASAARRRQEAFNILQEVDVEEATAMRRHAQKRWPAEEEPAPRGPNAWMTVNGREVFVGPSTGNGYEDLAQELGLEKLGSRKALIKSYSNDIARHEWATKFSDAARDYDRAVKRYGKGVEQDEFGEFTFTPNPSATGEVGVWEVEVRRNGVPYTTITHDSVGAILQGTEEEALALARKFLRGYQHRREVGTTMPTDWVSGLDEAEPEIDAALQPLRDRIADLDGAIAEAKASEDAAALKIAEIETTLEEASRPGSEVGEEYLRHAEELGSLADRATTVAARIEKNATVNPEELEELRFKLTDVAPESAAAKVLERQLDLRQAAQEAIDQREAFAKSVDFAEMGKAKAAMDMFADHLISEADMVRLTNRTGFVETAPEFDSAREEWIKRMKDWSERPGHVEAIHDDAGRQLRAWNMMLADSEIADAIDGMAHARQYSKMAEWMEKTTGAWRGLATLSVGFHVRNFISGMVNNFIAGVSLGDTAKIMPEYVRFVRGAPTRDPEAREFIEWAIGEGMIGRGLYVTDVKAVAKEGRSVNPLAGYKDPSKQWAPVSWSREVGGHVEDSMRALLAWSTVRRLDPGSSLTTKKVAAMRAVKKFHFDYSDLSNFDRNAKMFIPFWTFMSRNLVLQTELLATKPQATLAIERLFENLGDGHPENPFVPDYFRTSRRVQIGERTFLTLDLAFGSAAASSYMGSPRGFLAGTPEIGGSFNPLLRAPIEVFYQRDLHRGRELNRSELGDRIIDGVFPLWERTKRLAPQPIATPGQAERRLSSVAGWLGIPIAEVSNSQMRGVYRSGEWKPTEPLGKTDKAAHEANVAKRDATTDAAIDAFLKNNRRKAASSRPESEATDFAGFTAVVASEAGLVTRDEAINTTVNSIAPAAESANVDLSAVNRVVTWIADGDTFAIQDYPELVRIAAIDTPECTPDCERDPATLALKELIAPNTLVNLVARPDLDYDSGRLVADVLRAADDLNIGQELMRRGLAEEWERAPS